MAQAQAFNYEDVEDRDGVRLSWNVFAGSRIESTRTVVPIAAVSATRGDVADGTAVHAAQGAHRPAAGAVRARDVQGAVPRYPEPVLPDRRARQAVDLPVLPPAQRVPAALQGHFDQQPARRAPPQVYHHRVHPRQASPDPAHLPLRRRHLPRRGRPQGPPREHHRLPQSPPAPRPRRPHHLWHHGPSSVPFTLPDPRRPRCTSWATPSAPSRSCSVAPRSTRPRLSRRCSGSPRPRARAPALLPPRARPPRPLAPPASSSPSRSASTA